VAAATIAEARIECIELQPLYGFQNIRRIGQDEGATVREESGGSQNKADGNGNSVRPPDVREGGDLAQEAASMRRSGRKAGLRRTSGTHVDGARRERILAEQWGAKDRRRNCGVARALVLAVLATQFQGK